MTRRVVSCLTTLALCLFFTEGVKTSGLGSTLGTPDYQVRLDLTTKTIEQFYCGKNELRMRIRLGFTNTGEAKILLYKESSVVARYTISRSLQAAKNKKYEADVSPMLDLMAILRREAPDESRFVTLASGHSHQIEVNIYIDTTDLTKKMGRNLNTEEHFLQIRVPTWYYPSSAESLRKEWINKGFLWSESVTSSPMVFTVERDPSIRTCQMIGQFNSIHISPVAEVKRASAPVRDFLNID